MPTHKRFSGRLSVIKRKPLQAGKFGGILLTIVLGVGGFFRVIDVNTITGGSGFVDSQFLALVGIPLLSLGLVFVVSVEVVVTGYRVLRTEKSIAEQIAGRVGYVLLRGAEAVVAIIGVTIMFTAVPVLFAESTPAPAGVGLMLLLMAVGLGILFTSFVRTFAELFVYNGNSGS